MPNTLLLQLVGPMQAWGHRSRFDNRDTSLEPTRSGVVGLLCAALGWERDADLAPFAPDNMRMGVRVEHPGRVALDYHTAQSEGAGNATVSSRYYLADARFLVGLEGELAWLQTLQRALDDPKWPLFLGRKAFPTALPVVRGIEETALESALQGAPWLAMTPREWQRARNGLAPLKMVLETPNPRGGEAITDVPRDFERRRYGVRYLWFSSVQIAPERVRLWSEVAT